MRNRGHCGQFYRIQSWITLPLADGDKFGRPFRLVLVAFGLVPEQFQQEFEFVRIGRPARQALKDKADSIFGRRTAFLESLLGQHARRLDKLSVVQKHKSLFGACRSSCA